MKLLKAEHYVSGFTTGKKGQKLKQFKHRLKLQCEKCGKIVERAGYGSIKSNSCGCEPYKKHGLTSGGSKHPIYQVWHSMKDRCLNKKSKYWKRYGGRGIKITKQWMCIERFFSWAIKSGWKPGLLLDRRDNNGNYDPSNCRFVTMINSNRNRSNCITREQAIGVHVMLDAGIPRRQITKATNVSMKTINNISIGRCWRKESL